MASLDIGLDYKSAQDKIAATKAYSDLKNQYSEAQKKVEDSFSTAKQEVTQSIDKLKENVKSYQREIKNQFDQLLDISKTTGGKGTNTTRYLKRALLQALKNSYPKILEITIEESLNAVGCDQQQEFVPNNNLRIKISSIDFGGLLKVDPISLAGKVLYEKKPIQVQQNPFSMNKELYKRIQLGPAKYSTSYGGNLYYGASGQPLFDISCDNTTQEFVIDLKGRNNNINKVGEFMVDYYKTINVASFDEIMTSIMESLCGAVSINANFGVTQAEDATKFGLLIQRILGLCFDNKKEIDVSGVAKLAELDLVDETFFEFTDLDLRYIDQTITNLKNGVIEFEDCGNVKLPVDVLSVLNALDNLKKVPDSDLVETANNLTKSLTENPNWDGLALTGNVQAAVDLDFIKLLARGVIGALLTPKVLLPIFIMLKSLGQISIDAINTFVDFCKNFKRYIVNVVSKIGAIFVKELFEIIKRDIVNLIQQIVIDVAKETKDKRLIIILKLIQILIIVAQFVEDWRRCKSVVDELLQLLTVLTTGWGGEIPLPLLFGAQLLDGYSESRAFIGAIEEMQKLGIPTGPMPDGSPNLTMLSTFSQLKASAIEEASSGKVQIAIGPLQLTPAGLTIPAQAFGKKF